MSEKEAKMRELVRAWEAAYNRADNTRLESLFHGAATLKKGDLIEAKGAKNILEAAEFDRATKSKIKLSGMRLEGNTIHADVEESSELIKTAGLKERQYHGTFTLEGGKINAINLEETSETKQDTYYAMLDFADWAMKERAERFSEIWHEGKAVLGSESGEEMLKLIYEWKQKT